MIIQALILSALTAPQAGPLLPTTEPVFVEVSLGRGTLLAGASSVALQRDSGEQWVEGRGHLSLTASARATLRWHGRASLELSGPCEVEWMPCDTTGELTWSFHHVTRAVVEARKAPIFIELGQSWSAAVPPGAFSLRGIANGDYEVQQAAGAPAEYQWQGSASQTRPAVSGKIGKPVRLSTAPSQSRPDHSALLAGRPAWDWPWRDEPQDVHAWRYRDWPWIAGPPEPVTVRVERAPAAPPTPAAPNPRVEVVLQPAPLPTEPELREVVTEVPAEEPAAEGPQDGEGTWGWESDESETANPWRGLGADSFHSFLEFHMQNRTGIHYKELPDGGVRFWIPESYKSSGWVLGPRLDARLAPGSSIEFGPYGGLREHAGGVRVLAALER